MALDLLLSDPQSTTAGIPLQHWSSKRKKNVGLTEKKKKKKEN